MVPGIGHAAVEPSRRLQVGGQPGAESHSTHGQGSGCNSVGGGGGVAARQVSRRGGRVDLGAGPGTRRGRVRLRQAAGAKGGGAVVTGNEGIVPKVNLSGRLAALVPRPCSSQKGAAGTWVVRGASHSCRANDGADRRRRHGATWRDGRPNPGWAAGRGSTAGDDAVGEQTRSDLPVAERQRAAALAPQMQSGL